MTRTQRDFPDSWDNECDQKRVKVEVALSDADSYTGAVERGSANWIEIPTSNVTTWVRRSNEDADIKRTTKVVFPTEWDGASVFDVATDRADAYMFARVYYKDDNGDYKQQSLGYIDGVGKRTNVLESVMWVRDFSEFTSSVPLSATFNDPTLNQVLNTLSTAINERSPVPINKVKVLEPDFTTQFETSVNLAGPLADTPDNSVDFSTTMFGASVEVGEETVPVEGDFGEEEVDTGFDISVPFLGDARLGFGISTRSFRAERDTLTDGLDWLSSKFGARWFFEPNGRGVRLVIDIQHISRNFLAVQVLQAENLAEAATVVDDDPFTVDATDDFTFVDTVDVLNNDALRQLGTHNKLKVKGTSNRSLTQSFTSDQSILDAVTPSKKYPVATVTSERLKQSANGKELQYPTVETKAKTKAAAEADAYTEFIERVTEEDAGQMTIDGNPLLLPNDTIAAFEVCNDFVDIEQLPVRYKISEVKHMAPSTGFYRTEARVGIDVDTDNLTIESTMVSPPDKGSSDD
jgi:hypothetical protein